MPYSALRLCSGGGAYEAIPRPKLHLDLSVVADRLRRAGISVIDARVMLIAQLEPEVTVSRDGRILIKSRNLEDARTTYERLSHLIHLPVFAATR